MEQVTLSVTTGSLTLSRTTGLTFSLGSGVHDSTMQFTGSLADLNAALDGLTYTPPANFNGADGLGVTISDLGNTGAGGPLTVTSGVGIMVTAVNNAPINTLPAPQTTAEDTPLVFSTANGNAISVSDVDDLGNTEQVTLSVSRGTLTLADTTGVTFVAGADGTSSVTIQGTLVDLNRPWMA